MGKYPNSKIHGMYSDFHINLTIINPKYKRLYVSDIDRIWIEYDFDREEIVGVLDIKWENTSDSLTPTEKGIYDWLKKHNVRTFTVYINKEFTKFRVINNKGKQKIWGAIQYADFLLSLRNEEKFKIFINNNREYKESEIKVRTDFTNCYSKENINNNEPELFNNVKKIHRHE